MSPLNNFDGLPDSIEVDGERYYKTGNRDGWGVYILAKDWRHCCALDAKLLVDRDGVLIPIEQYTKTTERRFTPYAEENNIRALKRGSLE